MSRHGPAKRPCKSCPYRRDTPSGVWDASEYEKLAHYDNETGEQPVGAFTCHLRNGRLCAGWCAVHDMDESLGLRLALSHGVLTEADVKAAVNYVSPIPVWGSGAEAAAHGLADVDQPGVTARRIIDEMARRQHRRPR